MIVDVQETGGIAWTVNVASVNNIQHLSNSTHVVYFINGPSIRVDEASYQALRAAMESVSA